MVVRAVEWKKPYRWGTAIEITEDKVINLLLREANNLLHVNGNNELYCDLQLDDELRPTDDFPVGVTTGRINPDNWWDWEGTILCAKTTSGDNIKLVYTDEWEIWVDNGTGTFKRLYLASEVDALVNTRTFYITNLQTLSQGQEVYDWYKENRNAFVIYEVDHEPACFSLLQEYTDQQNIKVLNFVAPYYAFIDGPAWYSSIRLPQLQIQVDMSTEEVIWMTSWILRKMSFIEPTATSAIYDNAFIPTEDFHPATKKYVDDKSVFVGSTAPSNPYVWQLWFDNTIPSLQIYDGTWWLEVQLNIPV